MRPERSTRVRRRSRLARDVGDRLDLDHCLGLPQTRVQ